MTKVRLESDADSLKVRALGLVLDRYRNLEEMRHLPVPVRNAVGFSVLTADRRLHFVRNAKAGSTSIVRMIYSYAAGEEFQGKTNTKFEGVIRGFHNWRACYEALTSREPVIFCLVRNPYDRLMSGFRNFYVARSHSWGWRHALQMRQMGYAPGKSPEANLDVFLDYIALSFETDELHTDRHWRKQVHNIGFPDVSYDVIGRMETLVDDMKQVLERAKINDGLIDLLSRRHNHTDDVREALAPTAAQRRRIEELYADDFEAFGY